MIGCDRFESGFNCLVYVEARLVHEVVEALIIKLPLDFREDCFNWIELWRVTDVPYRLHVQLWPPLPDARFLMDVQIIHKKRNWFVPYLLAKLFEVVSEVFPCARLIMDFDQPNTLFLRHGCDHRAITDVDLFLINSQIRIFTGPFSEFE